MKEIPVLIPSQGGQIFGMWHQVAGRKPAPTVLFLHGFTGNSHEAHRAFVDAARALVSRGIAAVRIDFRGSGNSSGSFGDMTLRGELADAAAVLRWMRRQPQIDRARIGLLGMSMGGLITLHTVSRDRGVKAALLWNPAVQPTVLRKMWLTPDRVRALRKNGVVDYGGLPVGQGFFDDLVAFDPKPAMLTRIPCPVRFLVGTADPVCNPAGSEKCVAIMQKAGLEVECDRVEGADHCFNSFPWMAAAVKSTVDWFAARL